MSAPIAEAGTEGSHVVVRNLWTRLEERWVHRGVDLEVGPGDSLAVIGGSGSGKSTLMRVLIGLERPTRGDVFVGGVSVGEATEADLYGLMRRIGVLFQFGALFDSLSVWENVTFALRDEGLTERGLRRVAREKLKMVGLRDVEDQLPGHLSGGMRKRVALARAIAHDPEILLCDEPTSGLDPVTSDMISELILQMRDRLGVTTVTITHDMRSAWRIGRKIALLHGGRILACDTPQAMLACGHPIVRQFVTGRSYGLPETDAADEVLPDGTEP